MRLLMWFKNRYGSHFYEKLLSCCHDSTLLFCCLQTIKRYAHNETLKGHF